MATNTLRWQGWGISCGVHALLMFVLGALASTIRPVPVPEPFQWQVAMVQPPSRAANQPEPPPTRMDSARAEPVRQAEPVATRTVTRQPVVEQVRPVRQRPQPVAASRVMTRAQPAEQIREVATSPQVVDSTSAMTRTPVPNAWRTDVAHTDAPRQSPSARAVAQTETSHHVMRRETVRRIARPETAWRGKEIVQTAVKTSRAPVSQVNTEIEQAVPSKRIRTQPSTTTASAVRTVGQVRAHYGWLKADLMAHIERMKQYPKAALDNKWEGRVVVRAVIQGDGHLLDLSVVESSGHEVLDKASLELLRKISPLPLKHQLGASQVTLRIPINYGIR